MVAPSTPPRPSLKPKGGHVYVVRWVRTDGHETRQKFYRQHHAAHRLADALTRDGMPATIYTSPVTWTATT